jgi:hypothetical protein
MSSTRPGNQERGWNDPPEFLHNNAESVNLVTNQRTILNKRVGYNFTATTTTATTDENSTANTSLNHLPPSVQPPLTSQVESQNKQIETSCNSNQTEISVENIEKIINEKLEYLKEKDVSTKVIDDIQKRVKLFLTNWEKLSNPVKNKMFDLATGNYIY